MSTHTKVKWLSTLLGLCVIVIAGQSYYTWKLSQELETRHSVTQFSNQWSNEVAPWAPLWQPNSHFAEIQKRMQSMMNNMGMGSTPSIFDPFTTGNASPQISTQEDADQYQVIIQVPDGQELELNTDVSGNQLTISGVIKDTSKQQSGSFIQKSFATSRFSQTMTLPDAFDESKLRIDHEDEQVIITIPKTG